MSPPLFPPPPTKPKPVPPAPKKHSWEDPHRGINKAAPDWLNGIELTGERQCEYCGCSERALIRPDRKGMDYHYTDAYGEQITSLVPLSCPVFIGDTNGAVGETKERLRGVTGRVGCLEERTESVEERLERLEAENAEMKAQLAQYPMDVTDMVDWLAQQVQTKVEEQVAKALASVQVRALPPAQPNPFIDVIPLAERELVPLRAEEEEPLELDYDR